MISIRQRKGIKTTEVSEDYAAQEENVKLENKLPSGRCFKFKQRFGLLCINVSLSNRIKIP